MVHQYKLNGYNIVLDMASGAVHAVDEVAYDIIALYPDHAPEEIARTVTAKYPGVTEEDVRECVADVEALKADAVSRWAKYDRLLAGWMSSRNGTWSHCTPPFSVTSALPQLLKFLVLPLESSVP